MSVQPSSAEDLPETAVGMEEMLLYGVDGSVIVDFDRLTRNKVFIIMMIKQSTWHVQVKKNKYIYIIYIATNVRV